jgi:acyl-CoA hydrolase
VNLGTIWINGMAETLPPKPVHASRISIAQLMQVEHANLLGNVHGGWIMKLVDEAGALTCMRHAQRKVVTVAIDSMVFRNPIRLGDLVILNAQVTYTGRTSMEAEVQVLAENPITGLRTHTNTAYLVYVALDDSGRSTPVPPLLAETEEEKRRLEQAVERQKHRLQQR